MDFRAIARDCRTIRRFDEERRISGEDMLSIIDAARVVPSAGNRQPLKYMAIRDREGCDALFPHLAWAAALRDWDGPAPGERPAALYPGTEADRPGPELIAGSGFTAPPDLHPAGNPAGCFFVIKDVTICHCFVTCFF